MALGEGSNVALWETRDDMEVHTQQVGQKYTLLLKPESVEI